MNIRPKFYLLNFVFVCCVLILVLNDHYLKFQYPGWLTGKLSDVAGIIILPLLISYLFPDLKRHALWISAVLFCFWKTPYSDSLIDLYNNFSFIKTSRIVDYSDLCVLVFLPIPYFIIKRIDRRNFPVLKKVNPLIILLPTVLILMATSPPPSMYYTRSEGNLKCYKCSFNIDLNQKEILEKLRESDIVFDSIQPTDSFVLRRMEYLIKDNVNYYRANQLILEKDTLRNLDISMRTLKNGKTKIYFNGMQVSDSISDNRLERKLRRYYRKLIFKQLRYTLRERK